MRTGFFILMLLVFAVVASGVFAQTDSAPVLKDNSIPASGEEIYQIGDVRGTVRRKAVLLPKPPFPREALEAGADGTVKVEVVIDGEGSVVSAKAVSGNPMLYSISEETARKTKFRRAAPAEPTARETGTIVYSFAIEKAGWLKIGFDLAVIQKAPSLRSFSVPRVARAFQPDWTSELELLGKLAEMRRIEIETENISPTNDKPFLVRKTDPNRKGATQSSMRAEIKMPVPNPPTGERIAAAQNLTATLQSRLASDEASLWKFNLGINLAKAMELSRNPNEMPSAAELLRQSADSAPNDISDESLAALRQVIEYYENGRLTVETRTGILKPLSVLFNDK